MTEMNFYDLEEDEFKKEFIGKITELAKNTKGKLETYIVYGFENETNWCGTGINIRTLEFNANNKYDFWLQINDFFVSKKCNYQIFNYDWYMEMLDEEIEDEKDEIQFDMVKIIDLVLDQFKNNDTFWYHKFPPNKPV